MAKISNESEAIEAAVLPAFVDRTRVRMVDDPMNFGTKVMELNQELPAHLRRPSVRSILISENVTARVPTPREMRNSLRGAIPMADKTLVKTGETIHLPGANGEQLFFRVLKGGWFMARAVDVPDGTGAFHRTIGIVNGRGAAEVVPDLELYEGFRSV